MATDQSLSPAALHPVGVAEEDFDLKFDEDASWFGADSIGFVASLLAHMAIVLVLAMWPVLRVEDPEAVVLVSSPPDYQQDQLSVIEEVTYSEVPQQEVGANSNAASEMAESTAPLVAEVAEIPSPLEMEPQQLANLDLNNLFSQPVALLESTLVQKGKVGEGTLGATGAVDRLTFEILQALEERPTLVVWLFDMSGSLHRQRQEIRDRFDRIYEELGIVEQSGAKAFRRNSEGDAPLLTSIIGFGEQVHLLTEQPTADLAEIKKTVDSITVDESGVERVFSAVYMAADKYKSFRRSRGRSGPERNVLLVAVTDERGDDAEGLEATIALCRRYGMPTYVIGVPAPFGREHTYVKYVDPDPKYDQTPQWAEVDQGPETLLPERVQLGYAGAFEQEPVIDSGFGPFALTRLCYETGGIYFTVHPNRNVNREVRGGEISPFASRMSRFFDPSVMARYRPDYTDAESYLKQVESSPLRKALVTAAQMSRVDELETPQLRFVRRGDAQLAGELTRAQQAAARLEPKLWQLHEVLAAGEEARAQEHSPRWQAGYDLALGKVLATKVRTETYNAMLAKAKRGMAFEDPKNNTWVLKAAEEVSVGSKYEREATRARELLESVQRDHAGTPWAALAEQELKTPIGWEWVEEFTDLDPPRAGNAPGNNGPPQPGQDDQARKLDKPPPRRPLPKL